MLLACAVGLTPVPVAAAAPASWSAIGAITGPITGPITEPGDDVPALTERARAALTRLETLSETLDRAISAGLTARAREQDAAAAAAGASAGAAARVRALYMGGGAGALYASVLDAGDPAAATRRAVFARHVLASLDADAPPRTALLARLREQARDAAARAHAQAGALRAARDEFDQLSALLTRAERALAAREAADRASQAAALADAQLRSRLAALRARAETTVADRAARVRATVVPTGWLTLYQRAATTCPGLPWTVVAAIGQVESGHGANTATSYAGAMGPMQFLPATFAAYGVDGNGDGRIDVRDPRDAVFSAVRYLCANGAGQEGGALSDAIFHYNHADWYVAMVLRISGELAAGQRLPRRR